MLKAPLCTLIGVLAASSFVGSASAATINWMTKTQLSTAGDSAVSTTGTLFEAISFDSNTTDRTVNGVTFDSVSAVPSGWTSVSFQAVVYQDGTIGSDFERIMDSYAFSNSATTETLTISGLSEDQEYLIQVFASDDRSSSSQDVTLTYAGTGIGGPHAQDPAYALTGTFVADASTQTLSITSSAAFVFAGYQVRVIPEPGSLALLGLGGLLVSRRRRS